MNVRVAILKIFVLLSFLLFSVNVSAAALNLARLPEDDIQRAKDLITKLEPFIKEREAAQTLATLTFEELYAPLNDEDKAFLKSFQDIDAKEAGVKIPFRGIATGKEELTVIRGQKIKIKGEEKDLPPQYLPPDVYRKYLETMMSVANWLHVLGTSTFSILKTVEPSGLVMTDVRFS